MSGTRDPSSLSSRAYALWLRVKQIFPNAIFTHGLRPAGSVPPGGSRTSQHYDGDAFDFVVPGMDPRQVQNVIGASGLPYGQNIAEYGLGMSPRNHLSVTNANNRGENLVANGGVYRTNTINVGDGRTWLQNNAPFGLGDPIANILGGEGGVGDILTWPGRMLDEIPGLGGVKDIMQGETPDELDSLNGWFGRIALVVFALIFIAAALFTFKGSDAMAMVSKVAK